MGKDLFEWESHIDARTLRDRTLVVTLGAFIDAGGTQRLMNDHMLNTLSSHVVGRFDADSLIDYKDNRPPVVFQGDHFTGYQPPQILLHEVTDLQGERFLLLTGPEPATQWERLADEVRRIIETAGVDTTVLAHSVPMPTPHTRPILVTKHASDPAELIPGNQPMFGTIQMGASFLSLLEIRLGEAGHDVIGLAAHVPQYLAAVDFPDAALALVTSLQETTGLDLDTTDLAVAAGVVRAQIAVQVQQSEELTTMVGALEAQYDDYMTRRAITAAEESLPTADEIGDEAEEFLKSLAADHLAQEDGPDDEAPPAL